MTIKRFPINPPPETLPINSPIEFPINSLNQFIQSHSVGNEFHLNALINETLVGLLDGLIYPFGVMQIKTLVVHESHRLMGIGSSLLNFAFKLAHLNDCNCVCLETLHHQGPNYYPKFGFTLLSKESWGPSFDYYFIRQITDNDMNFIPPSHIQIIQLEEETKETQDFSTRIFEKHTAEKTGRRRGSMYYQLGYFHSINHEITGIIKVSGYLGGMRFSLYPSNNLEIATELINEIISFGKNLPLLDENHLPTTTLVTDVWEQSESKVFPELGFQLVASRKGNDGYKLNRYHKQL